MERGNIEHTATVVTFPSRPGGFAYIGRRTMPGCSEFQSMERLRSACGSIALVTERVRNRLWGMVERNIMPCELHIHRVSGLTRDIGSFYEHVPQRSIMHAHIAALMEDDMYLESRGMANRAIVNDNEGRPIIVELRFGVWGVNGWSVDVFDYTPTLPCAPGVRIITPVLLH